MSTPEIAPDVAQILAQQDRFAEAQRLAKDDKFRCRAACNRVLSSDLGVQINHHGTVALAVCFECMGRFDVILSRNAGGLEVKLRQRGIIVIPP